MAKSLQDRLKQRRSSNFVGREQQLELFRQNLRRSLDSEDYYFIFSVHGQGGVGKTTLLKKYRSLAKEADALTAYTNEETKSIPEVLARFAQQLKEQDAELSDFDKRYKVYLQEKKRLEADPEAPKGAWQLGGRLIARSSKRLAKEFLPGSGLLLEGMDADAIGDQMGEWASFVKKRLTNKDEVQLLLQPVEALTPLFLEGLEKHAENHRICLCFDTYEETDLYLDEWLRKLLEGQYGNAPENLLFVIAGREPLNPNAWSDYGDFIATIPLEAFSELEAKTYLERKGITDEAVMDSILGLSGRLPVLLATLAEAAKNTSGDLTDPCATAVIRFLKWIDDPVQRDLALHAALPRKLNQDIIQCLLPEGADAKALFQWLSTQPFVQKHQGGYWVYHSVVRELMLRHQFQLSQDTWSALHNQLADLYDTRAKQVGVVEREEQYSNIQWLRFTLERTYHQLCAAYQQELPEVAADFVTVYRINGPTIAKYWVEVILQSGKFWQNTYLGMILAGGIKRSNAYEWTGDLAMTKSLQHFSMKTKNDTALLYYWEGMIATDKEDYNSAIDAYNKAIMLNPRFKLAQYFLGYTLYDKGELEQAIDAFERAIIIDPKFIHAHQHLGYILYNQGKLEQSINYFNKAIEIDPEYELAYYSLSRAMQDQGKLDQALEVVKKLISINSDIPDYHNAHGCILLEKGEYDRAIEAFREATILDSKYELSYHNIGNAQVKKGDINIAIGSYYKSIELNPNCAESYYNLINILKNQGDFEQALNVCQKLIEIRPEYAMTYKIYGDILYDQGKMKEAINNYRKAIQIDPEFRDSYNNLGNALSQQRQLDNAIIAYKRTIEIDPEDALAYYNLGNAFHDKGDIDQAINNFQKAIQINPENALAYHNLGNAFHDKGDIDQAINNFQKAIQLNPEYAKAYYNLGNALRQQGNLDQAIENYQKAIQVDPEDALAYNNLGDLYLNQGKVNLAQEVLHKALQIAPKDEYALMNIAHMELASKNPAAAMVYYRKSRTNYHSLEEFFKALEADYEGINFEQYNIPKTEYFTLIQQLKDEINYTE